MEEKKRREEMELDYLAPFLAQIGDPEKLNRQQALKLKEDCLADLKMRLIDKANLIQSRFEKVRSCQECKESKPFVLPIDHECNFNSYLFNEID